jgi:integrase
MTNVMAGLRRPKQTRAEKLATEERKARALSDAEIIAVWNACEGRGSFGNLVRLLLLAGARRGEIAKLARDQIQSDRLVLPLLSTKTGERHEVPLTELMRTIIVAQPTILSALVFPLEVTGRQSWAGPSWSQACRTPRASTSPARPPPDLPHADVSLRRRHRHCRACHWTQAQGP